MIVYRVENHKGYGPYDESLWNSNDLDCIRIKYKDMLWHHDRSRQHPATYLDGLRTGDTRRHGFASIEDYLAWFDLKWRLGMAMSGFALSTYDVPKVEVGRSGKQVVFKMKEAEFVKCQPLIF